MHMTCEKDLLFLGNRAYMSLPHEKGVITMTFKDILKLDEGAHVVTVNAEQCMVVRLREGFTLTMLLPEKKMLIQRFSERGHLLWEDKVDNVFA